MKKIKVIFLVLLMLTAFLTLYYTVNKTIQSKQYAISIFEESSKAGNMGGRNGIRWKYG